MRAGELCTVAVMEQRAKYSHMLSHISWTGYFLGILAITAVYYLWVVFRFYRSALTVVLKGQTKAKPSPVLPAAISVMGAVAAEPERSEDGADISFGEAEPDEPADTEPAGAALLFTEIEALIRVISESGEPKDNFLLLAGLLAEKYADRLDKTTREQVCQRLLAPANRFAFELHPPDLKAFRNEPLN